MITSAPTVDVESHQFLARGGIPIHLRRVQPGDAPRLLELYAHLSPHSRLMRFNLDTAVVDRATVEQTAQEFADIDRLQGVAWMALAEVAPGQLLPVGSLRLLFVPPDGSDVAISVADEWQRQGVASAMVAYLREVAPLLGIRHLFGTVRADNEALLSLIRHLGLPMHTRDNGDTVYLDLDLAELQDAQG